MTFINSTTKRPVKVGNKIIGYQEDNQFKKYVKGSKHQLRQPPAWAIDAHAFDTEIKPLSKIFTVKDTETGQEYYCSIETFDRLKGVIDRGFGRQYFLTLNHWKVNGNGQQLSLWEGLA